MSLIQCPECGTEMSTEAKACPKCGAVRKRTKWWLWIPLGGVSIVLFFGWASAQNPANKERIVAREAISLCWKDQERKSVSPSTQRLMAGVCEKMEADFVSKWGSRP